MNCQPRMCCAQVREFHGGLLHAVFAEHGLPGKQRLLDGLDRMGFRHSDQGDGAGLTPGAHDGFGDAGLDLAQAVGHGLLGDVHGS